MKRHKAHAPHHTRPSRKTPAETGLVGLLGNECLLPITADAFLGRTTGTSGENVTSSALVFNIGIRLALENLFNFEPGVCQVTGHLVSLIVEEINADLFSPPLIQMN